MTFTVAKFKQEIAKEGIIPFAKLFRENRTLFGRWRSKISSGQLEPTPLGELFLHWMSAVVLILLTWSEKPASAYRILSNLHVYLSDIVPSFIMAIVILYGMVYQITYAFLAQRSCRNHIYFGQRLPSRRGLYSIH
ncbi:hypothetical protein HBI85_037310 [Parastagonospora nodorum]|nr:hypothetical protein HBI74_080870 [Parastagonospora nodorum]KAH5541053.1 hypothetical protein HBI27_090720 [Parastagonospora nodorum]KAH5974366.1 hypothetical protein HBI85_037310 [Parastagonospora nodorum]KAH6031851.1 hypothetical protein HBI83_021090 [Parastagonospora nodorum]